MVKIHFRQNPARLRVGRLTLGFATHLVLFYFGLYADPSDIGKNACGPIANESKH